MTPSSSSAPTRCSLRSTCSGIGRFALVGGLAVMARIGTEHRATEDLDGVFDNPSDVPTTAQLVAEGAGVDDPAPSSTSSMHSGRTSVTDEEMLEPFAAADG